MGWTPHRAHDAMILVPPVVPRIGRQGCSAIEAARRGDVAIKRFGSRKLRRQKPQQQGQHQHRHHPPDDGGPQIPQALQDAASHNPK